MLLVPLNQLKLVRRGKAPLIIQVGRRIHKVIRILLALGHPFVDPVVRIFGWIVREVDLSLVSERGLLADEGWQRLVEYILALKVSGLLKPYSYHVAHDVRLELHGIVGPVEVERTACPLVSDLKRAGVIRELVVKIQHIQGPLDLTVHRIAQVTGVFADTDHIDLVSLLRPVLNHRHQLKTDHRRFKRATAALSNDIRLVSTP